MKNKIENQGWIRLTLKRDMFDQQKKKFMKRKDKLQFKQEILQESQKNPNQIYSLRAKVKVGEERASVKVSDNHSKFMNQLTNIFRLFFFKKVLLKQSKKIQKARTVPDKKSKRSIKKVKKNLQNKERRTKRHQISKEQKKIKQQKQQIQKQQEKDKQKLKEQPNSKQETLMEIEETKKQ
eukprot:TRINITY_DN6100_c0_g1_i1.p2 TRINITY_DN6100_c0_g1~~TRINITY_DN6100_c0_g1_i1.p2  ORF type:complete len:180 (-),score=48.20 TRINITY_DN6100_c0_g1_i1:284-823(-)